MAVEATCDDWYILSAKHGLLDPNETIDPYDVALKNLSRAERRSWSHDVVESLEQRLGDLSDTTFEMHAGAEYRDFGLVDRLRGTGASVEIPTQGLTFGEQLSFYKSLEISGN